MAKLYYRYGAMNSGKTMDIMKTYYTYKELGMRALVIKPGKDKKGDSKIVSRNGFELDVDELIYPGEGIYEKISTIIKRRKIACILVDEAQFLYEQQVEDLARIADKEDVTVYCYGLRADFRSNSFPGSKRLFELADEMEELRTICRCGSKAIMNTRKINDNFVFDGAQVAIDGEDKVTYQSLCRKCWKEEQEKYYKNKNKIKISKEKLEI